MVKGVLVIDKELRDKKIDQFTTMLRMAGIGNLDYQNGYYLSKILELYDKKKGNMSIEDVVQVQHDTEKLMKDLEKRTSRRRKAIVKDNEEKDLKKKP